RVRARPTPRRSAPPLTSRCVHERDISPGGSDPASGSPRSPSSNSPSGWLTFVMSRRETTPSEKILTLLGVTQLGQFVGKCDTSTRHEPSESRCAGLHPVSDRCPAGVHLHRGGGLSAGATGSARSRCLHPSALATAARYGGALAGSEAVDRSGARSADHR